MYSLLFMKISKIHLFLQIFINYKNILKLGDIMAKNIERTPTLTGDSAKEFLEDIKRPNSPKEGI